MTTAEEGNISLQNSENSVGETLVPSSKDTEKIAQGEELICLKRSKRAQKSKLTRLKHYVEKLCLSNASDITEIEGKVDQLWGELEKTHEILDELSHYHLIEGNTENHRETAKESDMLETEIMAVIEEVQRHIKSRHASQQTVGNLLQASTQPSSQAAHISINNVQPIVSTESSVSNGANLSGTVTTSPIRINPRLKPLTLPVFNGEKAKFEEFWVLFESLVDCSDEPVNIKMARLRQSLRGVASEAIQGLSLSGPEYEEAKSMLKSKFGGQRRQLRAYMEQLEKMD